MSVARRSTGWRAAKGMTMSREFLPGQVIPISGLGNTARRNRGRQDPVDLRRGRGAWSQRRPHPSGTSGGHDPAPHADGSRWKFPISKSGGQASATSSAAGSSSTNTTMMSPSSPGILSRTDQRSAGSVRRIAAAFGAKSRKSGRRVSRIDQADARPRSPRPDQSDQVRVRATILRQ